MTQTERYKLLRQIMWDYHYPPEDVDAVLLGKKDKVGHYNKQGIFVKLLESYPWFTILDLFGVMEIKEMLTEDVIKKLWPKSLRSDYDYVQKRLHKIVPDPE